MLPVSPEDMAELGLVEFLLLFPGQSGVIGDLSVPVQERAVATLNYFILRRILRIRRRTVRYGILRTAACRKQHGQHGKENGA